jgi:hypothetical protein
MSIQAQGKFAFADVWHGTLTAQRRTILILCVLGLLTTGLGIWLGLRRDESWHGETAYLALGVFWLVYLWPFMAYRSYATLKKSPNLQGVVRFQFDESGYLVEAVNARAQVKWAALANWREAKNCFLLYQNPRTGSIVPKRFFQGPADVDTVRGFLRTHVGQK